MKSKIIIVSGIEKSGDHFVLDTKLTACSQIKHCIEIFVRREREWKEIVKYFFKFLFH